ncbi:MAG: DUF177 domain-containing protein [Clostridia bacterium]|nr:DUF177 domain-containing protein [Clostridia bacterium]
MLIDLRKFFADEAASMNIDYSFSMKDTEIDGEYPFRTPVCVKGVIKPFAGSAVLDATVEYDLTKNCDRCAEEFTKHYSFDVSHTIVRELSNEEDDDSYIVAEFDELDLDELIYSDIILEMPVKFLCRDDCKGLCPTCGANLNQGPCECSKTQIDPRMEILRKLIDD